MTKGGENVKEPAPLGFAVWVIRLKGLSEWRRKGNGGSQVQYRFVVLVVLTDHTCRKSASGQPLLAKDVRNDAYYPEQMQNGYRLLS